MRASFVSKVHLDTVAIALLLAMQGTFAVAQEGERLAQPPMESAAPVVKGDHPGSGSGGIVAPSGGVSVYQRMGAELPPLPPEKEYTGPVDEAYGAFQRGYYVTALALALERAQAGDAAAQTLVAEMMTRGMGIARNARDAAFWYGEGAKNGDPAAMFRYALLLMAGRDVTRDKAKADEYMKKAADAGHALAQFNQAQILVADNPGNKGLLLAMPYYEKSAAQGIADAQYALAQIYMEARDVPKEKKATARDWMRRAAVAGYDTAQLDMGLWLVNGVGGPRDLDEGFSWLRGAAIRGNVVARNKLAHMYVQALGTRPDPVEAAKWYVLSRRAGLRDPGLEDFYLGLTDEQQKSAIDAANRFGRS